MSDIERILYMGVGRSGLENENRVISEGLKELQKYKETGLTPQMINDLIKSEKQAHKDALANAEKLDEYKAIGTVDQCREAVERMKPKKPTDISKVRDHEGYIGLIGKCPCCGEILEEDTVYCDCGQHIDWSE